MPDIVYASVKFPTGFVGIPYEAGVATTASATPITAGAVQSGALPPGLVVNASDHVRITGTPTAVGTYTFTLSLTDTAGAVTSPSYTIIILRGGREPPEVRTVADELKIAWP